MKSSASCMGRDPTAALKALHLEFCPDIDRDRSHGSQKLEGARYFAHVGCKPRVVCIATEFPGLPLQTKLGLLSHEIGHVLSGRSDDAAADMKMFRQFGITIEYKNDLELQYIDPKSDFMKQFVKKTT